MKSQKCTPIVERKKVVSIMLLLLVATGIIVIGTAFSIFSVMNDIKITVLNSQVHGVIFGVVILFLGVRYFISVLKLKAEVYKTTSKFSWSNFKKEKQAKGFQADNKLSVKYKMR